MTSGRYNRYFDFHLKTGDADSETGECTICRDTIKTDEESVMHGRCVNHWHRNCIKAALVRREHLADDKEIKCPVCRGPLLGRVTRMSIERRGRQKDSFYWVVIGQLLDANPPEALIPLMQRLIDRAMLPDEEKASNRMLTTVEVEGRYRMAQVVSAIPDVEMRNVPQVDMIDDCSASLQLSVEIKKLLNPDGHRGPLNIDAWTEHLVTENADLGAEINSKIDFAEQNYVFLRRRDN